MRFPRKIVRTFPATTGKVTLFTDTILPYQAKQTVQVVGEANARDAADPAFGDIYDSRILNINGWPLQRVAVGYMPPATGSGGAVINGALWILDDNTGFWFQCPSARSSEMLYSDVLTEQAVTYFDVPAFPDFANVNQNASGSLRALLLTTLASGGPASAGDYTFLVATDISNPGL